MSMSRTVPEDPKSIVAVAREPTGEELTALRAYAKEHGLANACRVILNLNEFVFVD